MVIGVPLLICHKPVPYVVSGLPHVVVLVVVEAEGLCPPCLLADAGDVLLHLESDEADAVAVFVVLATGIAADEAAFDADLHVPRHAVVEVYHSLGVRGSDVLAVLRTLVGADLRQQRIDAAYLDDGGVSLLPYQPAQTVLVQRTTLDETQQVVGCLQAEYFFLAHHVFSVSFLQRCDKVRAVLLRKVTHYFNINEHYSQIRDSFVPVAYLLLMFPLPCIKLSIFRPFDNAPVLLL